MMLRRQGRIALAWWVVGALGAGFLVSWLPGVGKGWVEALAVLPGRHWPHTWVTYPLAFAGAGVLSLLGVLWAYFVTQMLAPILGSPRTLAVLGAGAAVPAVASALATPLTGGALLSGPVVPAVMATAVLAGRMPSAPVRLFGLLPLTMGWVAAIGAGLLVLEAGAGNPLRGIVLALPAPLFWLWGTGRVRAGRPRKLVQSGRGGPAKSPQEFDEFLAKVRSREQARREEEAVRRLLEGTREDPEEPPAEPR